MIFLSRAAQQNVETVEKLKIRACLLKKSQPQNGGKEMEIHVKPRQDFYRGLCVLSLNSANTALLLSSCANSGDTGFKNRVFLQAR